MNEKQIGLMIDRFYAKVRHDDLLGPIFSAAIGDQWDAHLATMRTFWASVVLGSATYKGNPMAAHLQLPLLTATHFDRWLTLWRQTADEVCEGTGDVFIQRAEAIARRLLAAVTQGPASTATVQIINGIASSSSPAR